jgi:hypothetical protein
MVTIRVDDPPVDIPVYKSLITQAAPYFRGAFDHSLREADEGVVRLADVSKSTFRIFLSWMHAQVSGGGSADLDCVPDLRPINASGSRANDTLTNASRGQPTICLFDEKIITGFEDFGEMTTMRQRYYEDADWVAWYDAVIMSLLSLYIFADKYSVTQLRDDIMSALMGHCIRWSRWPSSVSNSLLISSAYEHLPSNSNFCRFLAVLVAYL